MRKEFLLSGLSCPNCAAKIEAAVSSLPGVMSASCSIINTSLILDIEKTIENSIFTDVQGIVASYEPEVLVSLREDGGRQKPNGGKNRIIPVQIVLGAAIFAAALLWGGENRFWMFLAAYAVLGWKVILSAVRKLLKGRVFDENFLMSVATAGAFAVGEYAEGAAVMLFFLIGEYFQERAVGKSKKSISELMDVRPDHANVFSNGELIRVRPEEVHTGDIITVKPGERVPLDGVVTDGSSMLDTSALTGESVPREVVPGDQVYSGFVNKNGALTVKVSREYGESAAARIIDMAENAGSRKAHAESFITAFSRYYTPVVTGMALLLALLPPLLFGGIWADWIHRALVFLVISCPCALVVSIPLSFFGGIGGASRNGILVKGGNYFDALSKLDIVVFDKTGTLTEGVFEVTGLFPSEGVSDELLLEYAAKSEALSGHPVAMSITRAYGTKTQHSELSEYVEIPGRGVSVNAGGQRILAGNGSLMSSEGIRFTECHEPGAKVYVAVDGVYTGCVVVSDRIKPDAAGAVKSLRALGVRKLVMLTGDNSQAANAVASELGLDEVHAGLLPDKKVEMVERMDAQKRRKGKLAFVGDGVNDAPVLARADVGVAMGGLGSDAAIEASDVVLMTDRPSKLADAMKLAKATRRIARQNIILALGIKAIFLILGVFGVAGMWEAVFADVGVTLIAVVNAMRALRIKTS